MRDSSESSLFLHFRQNKKKHRKSKAHRKNHTMISKQAINVIYIAHFQTTDIAPKCFTKMMTLNHNLILHRTKQIWLIQELKKINMFLK